MSAPQRPRVALSVPLFGNGASRHDIGTYARMWAGVLAERGDVDVVRLDQVPYDDDRWSGWERAINEASALMVASWETNGPMRLDGDMLDHMVMARQADKPVFTQMDLVEDYAGRLPFSDGTLIERLEWPEWVQDAGFIAIGGNVGRIREYLEAQGGAR